MSGAAKHDQEKIRMELVPSDAIEALATILTFGAKKYAAWNWAKGFAWSRLYGAAMRHMTAWNNGEKCDPESGYSHLWHALCCIAFLVVHERRGLGTDDRHPFIQPEVILSPDDCTVCDGRGTVSISTGDGTATVVDCGNCDA